MAEGTYIVQVNVNTPKVRQHEVPNGIRPLNGLAVVVEGIQKPWVLGRDQLS